jgi:Helix-turn-helix domain
MAIEQPERDHTPAGPAMATEPPERDPTITEAADICRVHRNTIRRYLDKGRFPQAYRDDGPRGPWRIPHTDLVAAGLEPDESSGVARGERERARREMHEQVEILRGRMAEMTRRAELAEALAEEREKRIRDLRDALALLGRQPPE